MSYHQIFLLSGFILGNGLTGAHAAVVATDTFDGINAQNGGSGWAANWISTNQFKSVGSKIDGVNSYGGFGSGGTSRLIAAPTSTLGDLVTISWSIRSDYDVTTNDNNNTLFRQIGTNVLDSGGNPLLTLKFVEGNSSLLVNDGGLDFGTPAPGVNFGTGAIYRFTFTSTVGSNKYSFTANGNAGSSSATNFTYTGRSTSSFGGLGFFWTAPPIAGSDVFLDSVSVDIVPEPGVAGLALLAALGVMRRRR